MEYVITSGALTASVDTRGAQLRALKYKDTDYLWPGGDAWGWSAPVCCPWCGAAKGDFRAEKAPAATASCARASTSLQSAAGTR